jgi:predicted kinase
VPPAAPPILIVVGGLPGTGKTTVAALVARAVPAAYLRIDTIEQSLRDSGELADEPGIAGYAVGYGLAREQLRLGLDAVVECVNPLGVTRAAWSEIAEAADGRVLQVELVCSDPEEHRRRVTTRTVSVPGLVPPTWDEILVHDYEPWGGERLTIDTARTDPDGAAALILEQARRA